MRPIGHFFRVSCSSLQVVSYGLWPFLMGFEDTSLRAFIQALTLVSRGSISYSAKGSELTILNRFLWFWKIMVLALILMTSCFSRKKSSAKSKNVLQLNLKKPNVAAHLSPEPCPLF